MPDRKKPYPATSPEARALNLIGDKWTLLVVRELLDGERRFVTLQREGHTQGISSEQLRTRLNFMVADGLITRTRYREVPPRVMYELTAKGEALAEIIGAMADWGSRWATQPEAVAA